MKEEFSSDFVKINNWTATYTIDKLLAADIHLMPCHFHEGTMPYKKTFNISNISSYVQETEFFGV